MFNISSLAVAPLATLELNGPDGKPLFDDKGKRVSITMFGPASEECAEMRAAQQERLIARMGQGEERKPFTAAEDLQLTASDLAIVTSSFNNFSYPGEFATPAEMFVAAYSDRGIGWLATQANNFFGKWGNFPAVSLTK